MNGLEERLLFLFFSFVWPTNTIMTIAIVTTIYSAIFYIYFTKNAQYFRKETPVIIRLANG